MPIELYSLAATPTPGEYIIQKFDLDYHCESVYALTASTCMCPQGHKETCRHRKMLGDFLKHGHIGDGWFMEWQTRLWRRPVNDIGMEKAEPSGTDSMPGKPSATCGESDDALAFPPPLEGPTSLSPGAATVSPVGIVAPIIKRRKV